MSATGTTTVNFGVYPGDNIATTTVTGQGSILTGSNVEAFLMGDTSSDHSAYEHNMVPMRLCCGNIVASTGFDIVATCVTMKLTGNWTVRWVWA